MLINKIISYLMLPIELLSDEPGEQLEKIWLGVDIFLGRKVMSLSNSAPGFRTNRPGSGINLIAGSIGVPLNLIITSNVACQG